MSAGSEAIRGERPASARLFLPVPASAVFVAVMTASMVNVVMPAMREDFGASEAQVGWVVTGFMLVMAIGVPLYGRISDFFSLRLVFSLALGAGVGFALANPRPLTPRRAPSPKGRSDQAWASSRVSSSSAGGPDRRSSGRSWLPEKKPPQRP